MVTLLVVAAAALLGIGAVALLVSSLLEEDGPVAGTEPAPGARAWPARIQRVPKLRVAGTQPGAAHGLAASAAGPPQLLPPRTRLAPLLSLYGQFLEDT